MRGRRGVGVPNPFPAREAGAEPDLVAIRIAEFLADQVAIAIVAEERAARRLRT
jgi:hypothetical protein